MNQTNNGVYYRDDDGVQKPLYVPTPKQLEYHSRTEPNVLFYGGRGSGKSMCGRWDAHLRAIAHPGFTYVILRRTYPELQRSHLVHINREMKLLGGTFHNTDRVANYPNGSKGFFSHCATDEDVLNLLSAEFALAFFDELSTFEWEQFVKLAASVRVPVGSGLTAMVRGATNPLGPSAPQIMKYFVTKEVEFEEDPDYNPNDWYSIKANIGDNPHLDREQYKKRFSGLPSHVRKAWVDGDFVIENALFDFEPTKDGRPFHVIPELSRDELEKIIRSATIYRAIDVGWFPDPSIVLWIAHLGNRYIVLKDLVRYKTIAADLAEEIKLIDKELGIKKVAITYCDPSMDVNTVADVRTVKDIFELHGIAMECSINKRDHFAAAVHTALNEEALPGVPRIQFVAGKAEGLVGCPYLIKTIPTQRYDQKKPLFLADSKDDHGVVALAYFLISSAANQHFYPSLAEQSRPWLKSKDIGRWVLGNEAVKGRS
jgi:hypothetical protein